MKELSSLAPALLLAGTLAACSSAPGIASDGRIGQTASAIVNGKNSDASQDAVILLVDVFGQRIYECTGTLLAPNLVLTARHCVSQVVEGPFACDPSGQLVPGSTGGMAGPDDDVASMYVFVGRTRPDTSGNVPIVPAAQGARIFHDNANVLCGHDLALLLLDTKIPNAKIAPVRLDSTAAVGETFTAVGWGASTTDASPNIRQQRTGVKITRLGPDPGDNVALPSLAPNEFEVGESICQGDSGGPALSSATGAIIGTVSAGGNGQPSGQDPSATCVGTDSHNDYTELAPFKNLILQAYQAAGQDPWLEGGPNPLLAKAGDACQADTDCQSGACFNGSCGTTCDDSTPCTAPLVCTAEGSIQLCEAAAPAAPPVKSGCAVAERGSERTPLFFAGWIALVCGGVWRRRRVARARVRTFATKPPGAVAKLRGDRPPARSTPWARSHSAP